MSFWWVNHSQSAELERARGYIWSPTKEANGARSQFYDNMRLVRPGDRILSFSKGWLRYVGVAAASAQPATKPEGLQNVGVYWSQHGWLVPVTWRKLALPVEPKLLLEQLRDHLPKKYSPIQARSGKGNQKAYLSAITEELFVLIEQQAGGVSDEVNNLPIDIAEERQRWEDAASASVSNDVMLSQTERQQSLLARRGQGVFRRNVQLLMPRCPVTGIDNSSLLIASHIKPWRMCASGFERLDRYNGLMLTPHVDWLFDAGLISFDLDGSLLRSSVLADDEVEGLGLSLAFENCRVKLLDGHRPYMEYHRTSIFVE